METRRLLHDMAGDAVTNTTSCAIPVVSDVQPREISTWGTDEVIVTGNGFGPGVQTLLCAGVTTTGTVVVPSVSAQWTNTNNLLRRAPCGIHHVYACRMSDISDTQLRCPTVAGVGTHFQWRVQAGDAAGRQNSQYIFPANDPFRYTSPRIDRISGPGFSGATNGNQKLYLTGDYFGPADTGSYLFGDPPSQEMFESNTMVRSTKLCTSPRILIRRRNINS